MGGRRGWSSTGCTCSAASSLPPSSWWLPCLRPAILFLPRTRWLEVIVSQGWASLAYSENWLLQSQATDYYASNRGLASPFQHFWSLSIQGQVFILWPLIFVGAGAAWPSVSGLNYRALLAYVFGPGVRRLPDVLHRCSPRPTRPRPISTPRPGCGNLRSALWWPWPFPRSGFRRCWRVRAWLAGYRGDA